VKIVREETLIHCGEYADSDAWAETRAAVLKAIREVDWPRGTGKFTIYPESGRKRGLGNGVKPIKLGLMEDYCSPNCLPVHEGEPEPRLTSNVPGALTAIRQWRIIEIEWN